MKYVYPAIFKTEENGGYSIHFPDLESCYTQGDTLEDGLEMAEDVLCLTLYDMEMKGESIPLPTSIGDVHAKADAFVTLVRCDTKTYRLFYNNQAVKKTLSIPKWLNQEAIAKGINFSAVLQEALKQRLEL